MMLAHDWDAIGEWEKEDAARDCNRAARVEELFVNR